MNGNRGCQKIIWRYIMSIIVDLCNVLLSLACFESRFIKFFQLTHEITKKESYLVLVLGCERKIGVKSFWGKHR